MPLPHTLVAAALLAALALLVANSWDDSLDPEPARIMELAPPDVSDGENLYVAVSKFDQASIKGDSGKLCHFGAAGKGRDCLAVASGPEAEALAKLVEENRELEERYLALHRYTRYSNPDAFDLEATNPPWGPVILGQQLHLSRLALAAANGSNVAGRLAADHAFWRRFSANPATGLIEKMVANATLRGTLTLLGQLLRAQKLDPGSEPVASMLAPWTPEQLSLHKAVEAEFKVRAAYLNKLAAGDVDASELPDPELERWKAFGSLFYLPNATINALYAQSRPMLDATGLPCTALNDALDAMPRAFDLRWTAYLRNAVGNLLVSSAMPAYGSLLVRQCELEGLRRIVSLQARVAGVAAEDLDARLEGAGDDRLDPFTGQPMPVHEASVTFSASDPRYKALLPWRLAD